MVVAGDFKNGVTFDMDGAVMQVIEFQHVKPGKGAAFVRTKLRNVITGAVVERTFSPTDKYPEARIERKEMQYLYNDGDLFYFMDMETYEQTPIGRDLIGDNFKFVKEEMICKIISYKEKPRRYRSGRVEERNGRDRRGHQSPAVHQRRRSGQDRHAYRRVS